MRTKVPLWMFAACGLAFVFFIAGYVQAQFEEVTALDSAATVDAMGADTSVKTVTVSEQERSEIDSWIKSNNLNQYGESVGKKYKKGEPLSKNGQLIYSNRYAYIVGKNPTKPWDGVLGQVSNNNL